MPAEPLNRLPRVALAGWFGSDNLGDELILQALISALRDRGAESLVISIRSGRSHGGCAAVPHRSPAQHCSLVRTLRSVGAMAVAGGVMQAETSPWNIPFHVSRLHAAATAGCPFVAVGMGVGLVPDRLSRSLARRALQAAAMLVVRDRYCAQRLRRWGLQDVRVGADPVLALEPPSVSAEDTVCVILRHINRRGLGTAAAKNRREPEDAVLRGLARTIDAVAAVTGLTPRFVAFQVGRDGRLHRAVADRLKADSEAVVPTLDTVLGEVARSRLVLTMRYHGAVAALLHNRPAVLIDYSPKMMSLAAEGGGWASVLKPADITAELLERAVAGAFESAERIPAARSALRARLAHNDAALDALVALSAAAAG